MKDFAGKMAFITGGGSGAALGQAKVFSEAGCKIVIADVRQDHLDLERHFKAITESVLPMEADPEGVKPRGEAMRNWARDRGSIFRRGKDDN
jgi:NAD(P)-dependent dehydrogenase (short-subunit alcohol dehydrogenase family)